MTPELAGAFFISELPGFLFLLWKNYFLTKSWLLDKVHILASYYFFFLSNYFWKNFAMLIFSLYIYIYSPVVFIFFLIDSSFPFYFILFFHCQFLSILFYFIFYTVVIFAIY